MQQSPSLVHDRIRALIHDYYDFLIVVERFDESVVALALLTGLDVGDVLVRSSKIAGDAATSASSSSSSSSTSSAALSSEAATTAPRYTRKNGQCMLHRQQKMSAFLQNYTTHSLEWRYWNYADEVLWHAANASLDATIDRLGRSTRFQTALQQYYAYKTQVELSCPEPQGCTPGMPPDHVTRGCYSQDFGCGYPCKFVVTIVITL